MLGRAEALWAPQGWATHRDTLPSSPWSPSMARLLPPLTPEACSSLPETARVCADGRGAWPPLQHLPPLWASPRAAAGTSLPSVGADGSSQDNQSLLLEPEACGGRGTTLGGPLVQAGSQKGQGRVSGASFRLRKRGEMTRGASAKRPGGAWQEGLGRSRGATRKSPRMGWPFSHCHPLPQRTTCRHLRTASASPQPHRPDPGRPWKLPPGLCPPGLRGAHSLCAGCPPCSALQGPLPWGQAPNQPPPEGREFLCPQGPPPWAFSTPTHSSAPPSLPGIPPPPVQGELGNSHTHTLLPAHTHNYQ